MMETAITVPASHVPPFTSVRTAAQALPFDELRWENFEKLCYRLAGKQADIESHSLYGRAGQAQQGIDIFARKRNSRYDSWKAIPAEIYRRPVRRSSPEAGWRGLIFSTSPYNVQWMTSVCRRLRLGLNLLVATDRYRPEETEPLVLVPPFVDCYLEVSASL